MQKSLTPSVIFGSALLVLIFSALTSAAQISDHTAYNLMPMPREMEVKDSIFVLGSFDFNVGVKLYDTLTQVMTDWETGPEDGLTQYVNWMLDRLASETGILKVTRFPDEYPYLRRQLNLYIYRRDSLHLGVDESYELDVRPKSISITAPTQFGAMRAMETLLQLLSHHRESALAAGTHFPCVKIKDRPRFAWRGLLLDASRHFMPVENVFRTLDGMAAVKMNVLHWHLSDDHGWRVELKNSPELVARASEGQYYTQEDIRKVVAYAARRGIRVVPEVDMPGHASAILTAYPELGSRNDEDYAYHLQRTAGVFVPTLNPTREATYERIQIILEEMATLFPDPIFHIGGDENSGEEWAENEEIQAFMKAKGYANQHELQSYFVGRVNDMLANLGKRTMGWDEIAEGDLPPSTVIHAWRGWVKDDAGRPTHAQAAQKGHQVVVSMGYYLDLMYPASEHYAADPMPMGLSAQEEALILGGEACMWAELITPLTVDSRVWPRAAAVAERLWSPQSITDEADMYRRLAIMDYRLETLGLRHHTGPLQIMRSMAKGLDPEPLEILTGFCEPFKGYTRNRNGNLYTMQSPFTLFADACTADAPLARQVTHEIKGLLADFDTANCLALEQQLKTWKVVLDSSFQSHAPMFVAYEGLFLLNMSITGGLSAMHEMLVAWRTGTANEDLLKSLELWEKMLESNKDLRVDIMLKEPYHLLYDRLKKEI